ncbi:DUF1687-domain-containing protein [Annulohypoxylon maeteangense]|uniref:DUF1687-domain-containing protein n=1 Tax=Annulohypoxylon maeteangense TaxID=1927788 RepID=UPI002008103B|nr:DUF1687-domain-containing protein [Annulohypoxylon maeteangense]KAI0883807.1 DUF1687-domain-containing protein [Annulohypoxylon maeteangense]
MFRFHKPLDIVTLFHKAQSPASTQVAKLLKEASASGTAAANASDSAPSDQTQSKRLSRVFELDITETPPTADQLETILDYVSKDQISKVIQGATTKKDALERFRRNASTFSSPLVVDWHHGRAVIASSNSKILEMLEQAQADKE